MQSTVTNKVNQKLDYPWNLSFVTLSLCSDQGINRVRVEQMEARLKEDILMEASR